MRNNYWKISVGTAVCLMLLFGLIWLFERKSGDAQAQGVLVGCSLCCVTFFGFIRSVKWLDAILGPWFTKEVDDARTRDILKRKSEPHAPND